MDKHNELENVLQQFLNEDAGEFTDTVIPMTDGMIERLEVFAKEMNIEPKQAASFLLWSYLVKIEKQTNIIRNQMMN